MSESDQSPEASKKFVASEDPRLNAPHLYFNGFELRASLSDMSCFLSVDGQHVARLSMSFTTAKTLAVQLGDAVKAFEVATEHEVMTMEDVKSGYDKNIKT